jgi:hypothetical protein
MYSFTQRTKQAQSNNKMKKQQKLSGEISKQYGMQDPTHRIITNYETSKCFKK